MAKHPKYEVRVSRTAARDLIGIMRWSVGEFGEQAAFRYDALITRALIDIADDPERPGVQALSEIADAVFAYHFRHSRERSRSGVGVVRNPRHFVIYRRTRDRPEAIDLLRVLHDSRDLARQIRAK